MFDKEFYPTPIELIKIMLAPYKNERGGEFVRGSHSYMISMYSIEGSFLDPEGGKGDILDYIKEHNDMRDAEYYAIEIQPELQAILRDKEYQVVGTDFLEYECDMYYDHIIMNPPFSKGAEHLLKAIEIAENTQVTCLLNAETIRNPHTSKRKELAALIEKYNGEVEYHEGTFVNAERKTHIEVAIVRMHVDKGNSRFDFNFSDMEKPEFEINEDFMTNEIAREDMIGNLIHIFEKSREAYVEYMKAQAKWEYYGEHIWRNAKRDQEVSTREGSYENRWNFYNKGMKSIMWNMVIGHLDIEKHMSNSVLENFDKFIKQQSNMAFTKKNCFDFFKMIMENRGSIMEKAILEVFDVLTKHHHENRLAVEGWKTNDAYKVNMRVVMPYGCEMSWYGNDAKEWGTQFQEAYYKTGEYSDLDKVMCYITGKPIEDIVTIRDAMHLQFDRIGKIYPGDRFDNTCESEFFNIKFFKKGTVHLQFKDEKLWEQFNIKAAKGKNWLPENYEQDERAETPEPEVSDNGQLMITV